MALASVNSSYSGARWQQAPTQLSNTETARMAALFEERLNLPYSLCWHLASLGLNDETIADFLDPKLRTCLPDPYVMKDAEHAINLIKDVIKNKQPVGLFGDLEILDTGLDTMTGGRVFKGLDYISEENFYLTYGDGLSNVNLKELVMFHKAHNRIGTLTAVHPPSRFGEITIFKNQVTSFEEKAQMGQGYINGGFFIFHKKV